ncbi:hypothetical protein UFOVP1298_57 [uncultured Caudovirales phage]|jgi:hypothetical protein|uniref:Uncharacterized protein n=1 Tax=uncultured Caudovirales phage TaxID=2100421 RepID=A0A6J5RJ69_9CAUD|nr:hypothetical protein UFOVP1298_57 [uncultured Caudovirales phage]
MNSFKTACFQKFEKIKACLISYEPAVVEMLAAMVH